MNKERVHIRGSVAPGFETVRELFEQQMHRMAERQAQLCVYHRGERVVDLWADVTGDADFSADSLVNVFSSGKSLEAIAIASLVDRGLLRYDDTIAAHWPEFAANDKGAITVADLMRHEAGLANFDTSLPMSDLLAQNIRQNAVGRVIERHALNYDGAAGGRREYHALTRGWIVNELFRRVDPGARTVGEYLREEISGPLEADVVIGVRDEEMPRVRRVRPLGLGYQFAQSLVPKLFGRRIVHNVLQLGRRLMALLPAVMRGRKHRPPPPIAGATDLGFFNDPAFASGETPSANANCSARGLAKLAAMLAAGGQFEGRQYLGSDAWEAMHAQPLPASMGSMMVTRFTQGGVDHFTRCTRDASALERDFNTGREGFFGWMGFGGSIFQWHPKEQVGFAFVPTSLHSLDFLNERGKRYQAEVLRCVARLSEQP